MTPSSWRPAGPHLSQEHRAPCLQAGPEPTTQGWLLVHQGLGESPGRAQRAGFLQDSGDAALRHRLDPQGFGCDRVPPVGAGDGLLGVLGWMGETKRGTNPPPQLDAFVSRNTHTPQSS